MPDRYESHASVIERLRVGVRSGCGHSGSEMPGFGAPGPHPVQRGIVSKCAPAYVEVRERF